MCACRFETLTTAVRTAKVQEIAVYVNEKKREAENINQVVDVQSRLVGIPKVRLVSLFLFFCALTLCRVQSLAEASRRFVRQDSVIHVDGKGELMIFLFNDILVTGKETHGLVKMAENAKQLLGVGAKKAGTLTPKNPRKESRSTSSPFFGRKKGPQLQGAQGEGNRGRAQ